MRTIAELNVLFREQTGLPSGFKMARDEFREGWSFMRTGDVGRFKRQIQTRGWNFIKVADGALRSGVGDSSQEAIASALKLALRQLNQQLNAVEVEHIELTRYPWFFLARVRVCAYRIQEGAELPVLDKAPERCRRQMPQSFGVAMPMLREMLISSQSSTVGVQ
jgi:hypothetical protein